MQPWQQWFLLGAYNAAGAYLYGHSLADSEADDKDYFWFMLWLVTFMAIWPLLLIVGFGQIAGGAAKAKLHRHRKEAPSNAATSQPKPQPAPPPQPRS